MAKSLKEEFTKGIIKENPVLRLMLGTCATLAVTTAASNAVLSFLETPRNGQMPRNLLRI